MESHDDFDMTNLGVLRVCRMVWILCFLTNFTWVKTAMWIISRVGVL